MFATWAWACASFRTAFWRFFDPFRFLDTDLWRRLSRRSAPRSVLGFSRSYGEVRRFEEIAARLLAGLGIGS
jgi:hypothetical protein